MEVLMQQRRALCQRAAWTSLALALTLGQVPALAAGARPGKEDAAALVKRAVAYYAQHGRVKAFAQFNEPKGGFAERGMYIFVYDMQGVCLALGSNPRLIGKNLLELRDAEGTYMIKHMLEVARRDGKGWNEYVWINPASTQMEPKVSYFEKIDDVVIGAGVYR